MRSWTSLTTQTATNDPDGDYRLGWLELHRATNDSWTGTLADAAHSTNFVGNGQTNYVGGVPFLIYHLAAKWPTCTNPLKAGTLKPPVLDFCSIEWG